MSKAQRNTDKTDKGMKSEELFNVLYQARSEEEIESIIKSSRGLFSDSMWKPLGGNYSNFSVVKNQQSSPIAAIIEKVTNSIDALLMKRAYETGVDPKSANAPQSMEEAVKQFFPDHSNWDLQQQRRQQAEEIQVIADGKGAPSKNNPTCVIIYDNGEGQHPKDFEGTFLSLLRGNKNNVQFVQGKFNMGGSGALVFAGKRRFQLIASKRFDGTGEFGFTLIREHVKKEEDMAKETWYEYWLPDGRIPSFPITSLDLGLHNRQFKTGTIIKLYNYQFPPGYSAFAQDLNQSITEFLFEPALPILTKDTAIRYPNNKVLETDLYGLKRRLEREKDEYLEDRFSEEFDESPIGPMKVSCFVFKTKVKDSDAKETKETIRKRYFKNDMSVMFSMNGQVHGSLGTGFITQSLKMNMLKHHLLIHVDCTHMNYEFRKELFMASRDRLKDGEEMQTLRRFLADKLSRKGSRLWELQEKRKSAVDIDTSASTQDLLRSFAKTMPLDPELKKMLQQALKVDLKADKPGAEKKKVAPKEPKPEEPFKPERFPTFLNLDRKKGGPTEVMMIPLGGEKTIKLKTDVENDYFDRVEEPGEMKVSLLSIATNESTGGSAAGMPKGITDLFSVAKSSPKDGTIKIALSPKKSELKVGDQVQVKVTLTAPGGELEELFWVKIAEPEQPKEPKPKEEAPDDNLGLPELVQAYKEKGEREGVVDWDGVTEVTSEAMDYDTVMAPYAEGNDLKRIYVNMDSRVLIEYKNRIKNPNAEQLAVADRKYYTYVYFHSLFLYMITKNRGYSISMSKEGRPEEVDIGSYIKDLFDTYYSSFILTFGGTEELMQGLGD